MANKIYFFYKKNPNTGETTTEVVDADDRVAFNYYKNPRHFKYIGWSDGSAITKLRNELPRLKTDKDTGMKIAPEDNVIELVRQANEQELQNAINNPDKTPPPDLNKMQFGNPSGGGQVGIMGNDIMGRLPR